MFTETLAAKFPECRLPDPGRSVLRGRSSSNVKVILDTTSANSGLDANGWAKKVLLSGKVVFVERNCSKEPIYLKDLEELVGKEKVRFPMVIVNGKDLCGEEEVESLDDFKNKQKLIMSALNVLYVTERELKSLPFGRRSSIDGHTHGRMWKSNKFLLNLYVHCSLFDRLPSTFIQNTVKLFREKLAAKFPQCRLPTPDGPSSQGSSSSSMLRPKPSNDEVILYTISVDNGLGANGLVKNIQMSGNSEYMRELGELVGNDRVRFPMVTINGKDLCGAEEVEGLDDFENKQKVISVLNHLYLSAKTIENLHDMLPSTFIQNTVKLFREKLAAKFPQCRLPTPDGPSSQGSSSSSMLRPKPSNDEVILYTISVDNGLGANGLVKNIQMSGNVLFEERNC
ncbi:hypothetical protein ACET3Z_027945 [Daucus carota]